MKLRKIPLNQNWDWERENYQEDKFYHSDRERIKELLPAKLPPYVPPVIPPKLAEYWKQNKLKKILAKLASLDK
jgi:hypothetical protein